MFTLKLRNNHRIRIVEAESVTVYCYNDFAVQITPHGSNDGPFYVGTEASAVDDCPKDQIWYDTAYVENASGKTTQIIAPNPWPGPVPATVAA